ncbi:ribonuclease HI family protein [Methanoculleus sp. FWC-SCC1]|uniref:Ribonuclease HI family protein n=1 Tax=Methanoculleus frigidifontis TaxID=2584085 RepID=A0ABT8M9M2_9EURY|nr:ribonuclease HI family protein [Methanoculleus sp. FWC-SCC1]MDN7024641.1 ribonuclease HI family protein [Methanoculleus sp. FWC-SCC1]
MTTGASLSIYTDGASRGNPGAAAWAFVFVRDDTVVQTRSEYLGIATNNVAEYHAVINALAEARTYTGGAVTVYSDSELVVRQLTGRYRIRKEHLAALHREVIRHAGAFAEVSFISVPRDHPYIRVADRLCNETLDRCAGGSRRR